MGYSLWLIFIVLSWALCGKHSAEVPINGQQYLESGCHDFWKEGHAHPLWLKRETLETLFRKAKPSATLCSPLPLVWRLLCRVPPKGPAAELGAATPLRGLDRESFSLKSKVCLAQAWSCGVYLELSCGHSGQWEGWLGLKALPCLGHHHTGK